MGGAPIRFPRLALDSGPHERMAEPDAAVARVEQPGSDGGIEVRAGGSRKARGVRCPDGIFDPQPFLEGGDEEQGAGLARQAWRARSEDTLQAGGDRNAV